MKINPDSASLKGLGETVAGTRSAKSAETTTHEGVGSAAVELSATSKDLSSASDAGFDGPKVDTIKLAISAGKLQINPEAIAHGLISSVTQLLSSAH